jgi:prepilin-type N-terminal cleavage/methylation domain-containing protein
MEFAGESSKDPLMPRRSRLHSKEGFTLVEVLVASVILSMVFVSSIGAMTIGYRLLENARFNTLAAQIIQSEIETLRLMNWSQISTLPANEAITIDTALANASVNRFTGNRIVTNVRANTKAIVVNVQWTAVSGQVHSRRYMTFMGKDGLNDYYYTRL